jgi:hypothetical protein
MYELEPTLLQAEEDDSKNIDEDGRNAKKTANRSSILRASM